MAASLDETIVVNWSRPKRNERCKIFTVRSRGSMLRLSVRTIHKGEGVVVFVALLGFVVILQFLGGAYASGFGGYPDEPAHLVTSLMVRDFLASLDFRHSWQFAQQYYYHYPKVAIGVWPPGF